MRDPAIFSALLANIFRLLDDGEYMLAAGRFASACDLAVYALEEAGKYAILVGLRVENAFTFSGRIPFSNA